MVLFVVQTIIAILLIVVILLQARGSGLSSAFGGSGEFYRSRRSLEKILLYATIVLAILFGSLSFILFIR